MSRLGVVKRKAKIAKLKLELKWLNLSRWWKLKKAGYIRWRLNRLESREEYLESRSFQQGDEDE